MFRNKFLTNFASNLKSSLGLISQEYFFIEYGHDGYQKNPLLVQISKKSSYLLSGKMHLEKGKGKNVLKNL
jgi:hypothetical protein